MSASNGPMEHKLAVAFVSFGDFRRLCGEHPTSASDQALSCFSKDILLATNPCTRLDKGWYERLLCHELGHVNGWAADHSGGAVRAPLRLASSSPEALALQPPGTSLPETGLSSARNAP